MASSLLPLLESRLPPPLLMLLRSLRELATELDIPFYLVGGSVRDLLIGSPVKDLDLVVEGDASVLAFEAAKRLSGEVVSYEQFGTATLKVGAQRLDLATARTERYPRPGALPVVTPSTIHEDLGRRDFSINAIAVRLSGPQAGEVLDPFGGRSDLDRGLVRVLHDRSFVDDATRILRAVRYEQRLGFRLEEMTERLLRQALDAGMLDTISGDRVRRELALVFQEPQPSRALRRMAGLGVLGAIYPPLAEAALPEDEAQPSGPLVYLGLLSYHLTPEQAQGFIHRLNMPSAWAKVVRDTVQVREREGALARPGLSNTALWELLEELALPALEAAATLTASPRARERLRLYLDRLRHVRPSLNGRDLLRMGVPQGPMVGELLRELRRARLEGDVATRADEERLVRTRLHAPGG